MIRFSVTTLNEVLPLYSFIYYSHATVYFNRSFIIEANFSGSYVGANLEITLPFLSTKNLVKFHFISSPSVLNPRSSSFPYNNFDSSSSSACGASDFKNLYKSEAFSPFTSILAKVSKVVPYVNLQKLDNSASFPGACWKN